MYKFQQARPNTESQAEFRQKYLSFKKFQNDVQQSVREVPKVKKVKDIEDKLQDPLILYELYLKILLGLELSEYDNKNYVNLIGGSKPKIEQAFYPDGIISFPNPDCEEIIKPSYMSPLEFFDFLNTGLKLNQKSFNDQLLIKAIETAFQLLSIDESEKLNSSLNDQLGLQSQQSEVKYKQLFTQQTFSNRGQFSRSFRIQISPIEKINQAVQNLRKIFEEAIILNPKVNLIDCINLDYKIISELQPRLRYQGEYLNQIQEQWIKTTKESLDTSTLLRQVILLQLGRKGFQTKQVMSNDGQQIFFLIKMDEDNLKIEAEQKKISKKLNFWFCDLFSLEPVDKRLRPLRLNNRLWKIQEYKCSEFFEYLRPQIIELIDSINFKRISREVNQSHLNQELFVYGKQDLNDEEENGPSDEEWFSYYKYLVHLQKKVQEHREEYETNSDLAAIMNKQINPFLLYLRRFKKQLQEQQLITKNEIKLNEQNILLPENEIHLKQVQYYEKQVENLENQFRQYMIEEKISLTKYIKILKQERLAYNYMNSFLEALQVANVNNNYLKSLWNEVGLSYQEPYVPFKKPSKNMAPTLQAQQMMLWKKYQKDEEGNISIFSSTDILKLTYSAVCDCFDFNSFCAKGYVNQFFSLNDQYELYGFCQNIEQVLSCETQFFEKKQFQLVDEWKFNLLKFWEVPINVICSYFGEKIGLYFYFMSYFIKMMTFISIIGFFCSLIQWIFNEDNGELSIIIKMIFTMILIQWNNIFTDYWQQQQLMFNIKFGQINQNEKQTERASFKGTYIRSIENDQMNSVSQNDNDFILRLLLGSFILLLIMLAYCGMIVGLFAFTSALQNKFNNIQILSLEVTLPATFNVFIQQFLDKFYDFIAISITDYENHKTNQKYETSFVVKKFILYFFSYIIPLLFIGYFNGPLDLYCSQTNCSKYVQYYFSTIILWLFTFKIFILMKFIADLRKYETIKYEINDLDILFYTESSAQRPSYAISPERYGTLEDYMEVLILYSLLIIFGYSFSLSFMLLQIFNVLQIQIKKYQFLYILQRPWPQNESSLGIWNSILALLNSLSLFTNTGVITILYSRVFEISPIIIFLSLLTINSLFKFTSAAIFGDTPFRLTQLIIRHKYLLKSTMEVFSKSKQRTKNNNEQQQRIQRLPILKIYNSHFIVLNGSFETISSQSDLDEHVDQTQAMKDIQQQITKLQTMQQQTKQTTKQLTNKKNSLNLLKKPVKITILNEVNFENPPYDVLQSYFTTRVSNWAFEIQYNNLTIYQRKIKLQQYWKYLYKLYLLTNYKKLWTEERINQRHFYIKRRKLLIKNLDGRKLFILRQNFKQLKQAFEEKSLLKFRKQIQSINKSSHVDDQKDYENILNKKQKFIDKHTWLNCRKVVVLKINAVWIRGFRKSISRRSALINVKNLYKQSQLSDGLILKSNIHSQYNKMIENNTKMNTYGITDFINMLGQLDFQQNTQIIFPLTSQKVNLQHYILYPKKSGIFKTIIDKLRDTFIFDEQISKLQEISMQFFIEEQFQTNEIELIKHFHGHTWLGKMDSQEYLIQFLQIPFGIQLNFQEYLDSKHGVYYAESKNYVQLSNLIDQIDDFTIKGYCMCLYQVDKPLSLWQVIKYRQTYGQEYTIQEINQFLYANLILMKSQPHNDISIHNYFLDGQQYALLNSLKNEPPLFNLAKVIIQMISLKQIDDPFLQLNNMNHQYTDILRSMLNGNITIEQIVFEIKKQQCFQEMLYVQDIFKLPEQNFYSDIQLYLHKINCSYRMKCYNQTILYINQFDNILKLHYPPQQQTAIQIFAQTLKQDINHNLLQPNWIQKNQDIILIYYIKIATFCSSRLIFDDDLNILLQGIINCINEINLIIRQLCLNIEFQNLPPNEQYTLLRKRRNKQKTQLFSQERMILLESLRFNQDYLEIILEFKTQLQRYSNQLNSLKAIDQYLNKNYGFGSFLIQDCIKNSKKIIKPMPLPQILAEARTITLEKFNLDQFSPQLDDDENIDLFNKHNYEFKIEEQIYQNQNYCLQYLYFEYLQLIIWYDEQNGLFDVKAKQYVNYLIEDIPSFNNLKIQIMQLLKLEINQMYMSKEEQCEIGKYYVLKLRKWNESNFGEIYDIQQSQDLQYMWVQLMTQSLIKVSINNNKILTEIYNKTYDDIKYILLKIRVLMQILHMNNIQPINLIVHQQFYNFQQLNYQYEEKSKIIQLKKLITQFKQLYYILEESWFQHSSLSQLRIFYQLAICFAYSPKHIENIRNQNNFEIIALQTALNQIMENKTSESYHLILKAAQIVLLHDYCNLLDDEAFGITKYQQIHTFMILSLQQGETLQTTFEAIRRIIKYNINPSAFVISLITQILSFSLIDLADVLIRLIMNMCQLKAEIFENAYDGFQTDLQILSFYTKSPQMNILKPFDQLYIRYPSIQETKYKLLDYQSLLYYSFYHEAIEEQAIQLYSNLKKMIQENIEMKIIQLYESQLLTIYMYIGEEIDQLFNKVKKYQLTNDSIFQAIIFHQLSRFYSIRFDYQLAYDYSYKVLSYIYSSQFEDYVSLKIDKNEIIFQNNIQNGEIMNLFQLKLFECVQEEEDQLYINIIDEMFVNEQILIHIESIINLQFEYKEENEKNNINQLDLQFNIFKMDEPQNDQQKILNICLSLSHLLKLLLTLPERSQQLRIYYFIALYLLNNLSYNSYKEIEINLKNNYKIRIKEIRKEKEMIKATISSKIQSKELTEEMYLEAQQRKDLLAFEESILSSIEYGLNKAILLSWIHQALERAKENCEYFQEKYQLRAHHFLPKVSMLFIKMYQESQQIVKAVKQISIVDEILNNFFLQNSHSAKGVFFYLQGKQKQWLKTMYIKYIEQIIEFQCFNLDVLKLITKRLLDQNEFLYDLWEKFDSAYRDNIPEQIEYFIIEQIGHIPTDNNNDTDLKVSLATTIVEELIQQFQTEVDVKGTTDFIYAQAQFDYYKQDNFYVRDIKYMNNQNKIEQELILQRLNEEEQSKRRRKKQ